MLKIGITGGIGAGKSLVTKIFATIGVPVYDADTRAKWLQNNDPELKSSIISLLGERAFNASGLLQREWVAKRVFENKALLHELNGIVHPKVYEDYEGWCLAQSSHKYILKEAALLFESGSYTMLDKTILVTAPEKLKIARVLQRDSFRNENDVIAIMAQQLSDEDKRKAADYIILNDETQLLIPQVLELDRVFRGI